VVGALLGSAWYLAFWLGAVIDPRAAWLMLSGCAGLATAGGWLWPTSWQSSARLVDGVYGLKDRTSTALDFAARGEADPIQSLQVQDAFEHLARVDAGHVVPWKAPRLAPAAIAALVLMIALGLLPMSRRESVANAPAGPLEVVLDQAALLEETMVEDLEKLADDLDDAELKELAEEIKKAVEELKDPNVDQREALAMLSQMQATLAAAAEQLDVQEIDAQLQELAQALEVASATEAASQSLKASDYDQAAKELEKIEASTMSKKERDAVASNLSKLNSKLGQGKKGQLSQAVQEALEGLSSEDDSKSKEGFCKAAGVCRKQGLKKKISHCLACQLNRLSECKGCCQGGIGNCRNVAKSDHPSNSAGRGASNKPFGEEKTKLDSKRRDEDLVGAQGEGPSERETLSTAEARQDAARSYRERYTEFKKQMEEVLDSEPLPLGHRETVRKYFEAIRPTSAESDAVEKN
jgi:hypothetical protein